MAMRAPAGFISAFFDPLKNPNAPTSPSATGGDQSASVTFTAPSNVGGSAITAYYAVSNPGQFTGNAASSPVTVTGLTNGTPYTFNVWALNSYGPGVFSAATNSVTPVQPSYALFSSGYINGTGAISNMNYVNIDSTGNATLFGYLTDSSDTEAACGSTVYGLFKIGTQSAGVGVDSVVWASTGSGSTFGNLSYGAYSLAACNDATRGVFAGGRSSGSTNAMSYVTIASSGSGSSFGELAVKNGADTRATRKDALAGCSSPTRGIFAGGVDGWNGGRVSQIQYITIATTGNSSSFGNLTLATDNFTSASNATYGLFLCGNGGINTISYITIASTGAATSFGTSAQNDYALSSASNSTRIVYGGGANSTSNLRYVTIGTSGSSTTFGNLTTASYRTVAASANNGGTQ